MKLTVLHTRPSCWGNKYKSDVLDLHHVPIGHPTHLLRKGEPAGDNMGEVMTGAGEKLLVKAFDDYRPDIFLFWPHFGCFSVKLLKMLRNENPDCIFVHGSGNHVLGPERVCWFIYKFRKVIDVVLTSTTDEARKKLFARHVDYVDTLWTFGFEPEIFKAPTTTPQFDVFFGGGDSVSPTKKKGKYPYSRLRHDLIMRIAKERKLLLRGGGTWKHYKKRVNCRPGIMDGLQYFREMQKAKIVLGTYHDDLERRYSKRTVYGGATGRLFMTRYIPNMQADFTDNENIVWFKTVDEAMDKINYYLKHDGKREAIARKQRKHFIRNHSWEARLKDFEKVCARIVGEFM
jgi:hypothetical protein